MFKKILMVGFEKGDLEQEYWERIKSISKELVITFILDHSDEMTPEQLKKLNNFLKGTPINKVN